MACILHHIKELREFKHGGIGQKLSNPPLGEKYFLRPADLGTSPFLAAPMARNDHTPSSCPGFVSPLQGW
jgi:hypothetical protein